MVSLKSILYLRSNRSRKKSTRYSSHYYDLLVTKIDPNGELAWMRKLPKRQTGGGGRGGMSFKHMAINGNHYFIYLDNVKNMELPLDKRPSVHMY